MRILITGGLGTIGGPLDAELRRREHTVQICDLLHAPNSNYVRCDVADFRQVQRVIETVEPEFVYHLAAEFGRKNGEEHYEKVWYTNAIGTKNLLLLQEQHKFRMCFSSSSEVYGDWEGTMSEDVPLLHPIRQLNDYAISKWVNEMQILNAATRFGTETVRVRLFNTYGPGEHYSEYRSVICQFVYRALHDMPYTVYLDHHRTSSYISDTVNTLANISDPNYFTPGEVYNIAGSEYHDIKTISDMILAHLGKDDHRVNYEHREVHNTRDKKGDMSKAQSELGHQTRINLATGIPLTIKWQKATYGIG